MYAKFIWAMRFGCDSRVLAADFCSCPLTQTPVSPSIADNATDYS